MKILVLGGGLVGRTIALDLSLDEGSEVTVGDLDPAVLEGFDGTTVNKTLSIDVTDAAALDNAIGDYELIVCAVPGHLGHAVIVAVINAGRQLVDISFGEEDPLTLHDAAVKNGVTAIVDAGISPGLANLILGRFYKEYDSIDRFIYFVGGLPEERHWPFEYMSVFSPIDVIEEYTRPARMKSGGKLVVRPALSDVELVDFPLVGTLEAFSTDGLRTLLTTLPIPYMKEKTLRYPGHADRMRMLLNTGFFSTDPIEVGGQQIIPREVTAELLFRAWAPRGNGRDLAVMRVEIEGILGGKEVKTTVDLYDGYDQQTGTTAMARTTGFTCSASARLIINGTFTKPGVYPLELVGFDETAYQAVLNDLSQRDIFLQIQQQS